ncbi:MAG: EexN family lipoprotein [Proteobacteria bacterium]|nr:EexN family lipoprotein [Pseudomonadota bacterium]
MNKPLTTLLIGAATLAGCQPEPPPARTVDEFVDNPILLEAVMVRCSRDSYEYRYDEECRNARAAVSTIQAKEEEARRKELEARSERKREALRRTRQAEAEARRRAEEAERLRKEAEYLAQFGVLPPGEEDSETNDLPEGNVPIAVVPETESMPQATVSPGSIAPATPGGNAPTVRTEPAEEEPGTD